MGTRTLYVSGGSYESVNMRESICDVLELAEEKLGATGVVMVLEKESADIGEFGEDGSDKDLASTTIGLADSRWNESLTF